MPWLMHLFGLKPWEMELLEYADFEELCRLVDMWIENGGKWQRPPPQTGGGDPQWPNVSS